MKQVDVFGLPVHVGTPEEIEAAAGDRPIHLVNRVADMVAEPYPALAARRFKTPCADCRELCWLDPKSLAEPSALVVCFHCLPNHLGDEKDGL